MLSIICGLVSNFQDDSATSCAISMYPSSVFVCGCLRFVDEPVPWAQPYVLLSVEILWGSRYKNHPQRLLMVSGVSTNEIRTIDLVIERQSLYTLEPFRLCAMDLVNEIVSYYNCCFHSTDWLRFGCYVRWRWSILSTSCIILIHVNNKLIPPITQ